jgi:nitroreductase
MMLETISGRCSVRAFLDRPVSRGKIEKSLAIAARAEREQQPALACVKLSAAILAERASEFGLDYRHCPNDWSQPYLDRRHEFALAPEEMVICGLSLGFEDKDALPNRLHDPRRGRGFHFPR